MEDVGTNGDVPFHGHILGIYWEYTGYIHYWETLWGILAIIPYGIYWDTLLNHDARYGNQKEYEWIGMDRRILEANRIVKEWSYKANHTGGLSWECNGLHQQI